MVTDNAWVPAVDWTPRTRNFVFFAAGVARQRLSARGRIIVRSCAEPGGGRIDTTWFDEDDREALLASAHYLDDRNCLKLGGGVGGLNALGSADLSAGRLTVERPGADLKEASFDASQLFDWRIIWGFRLSLTTWTAGLGGVLALGAIDWSSSAPSKDECVATVAQTDETDELVSTPAGARNLACWRIESSGPGGREAATIGKANEGLVRFDMNLADSGLLIGIAG